MVAAPPVLRFWDYISYSVRGQVLDACALWPVLPDIHQVNFLGDVTASQVRTLTEVQTALKISKNS